MYHVGNPEIFDGNKFLPLTGIPMSNNVCRRIRFADCEPVPFAVAMLIVKSFTILSISGCPLCPHPRRELSIDPLRWPTTFECVGDKIKIFSRAALKTRRAFAASWPTQILPRHGSKQRSFLTKVKQRFL